MIISKRKELPAEEFVDLLKKSHEIVDQKAVQNSLYFECRSPVEFEKDVYNALCESSIDTGFSDSIELVSGKKFPDIVAQKYYGVEVKSSQGRNWKSVGNSVLESTRIDGVETIYLFFGQLAAPAKFKWRLYQECLFDIAVTHSPRYLIDMDLAEGGSIFDKMEIEYNDLRKKNDPITHIVNYYRRHAKRGEEPWWMASPDDVVPLKVKLWGDLNAMKKRDLENEAMARFPEIFSKGSRDKYKNLAAWLAARHGIVSPSVRDSFSAGGVVDQKIGVTKYEKLPQVFSHLKNNVPDVIRNVKALSEIEIQQYWGIDPEKAKSLEDSEKLSLWSEEVIKYAESNLKDSKAFIYHLLSDSFPEDEIPHCVKEGVERYML